MNKIVKKGLSLLSMFIMVFSLSIVSHAAGTTSITVSSSTIGVGDTVTVTINASASGTVTVKYTASLLELSDCTASGYTSEDNVVTFSGSSGDLIFKATAEGTASVIASSTSCSASSTTLSISGTGSGEDTSTEATETTDETAETAETTDETAETTDTTASSSIAGTLNDAGGFDIDGVSYVVSERYSDSEIPTGFSKVTLTIGSSTYNELSNGTLTLLYLKPADNTDGSGVFYLYDEAAGTVSTFEMVGTANNYVILSAYDSLPNSSFYETTLTTDSGSYTAYTFSGSEFAYLYGTNDDGVTGWFMFDPTTQIITRADTAAFSLASDDTEATTDSDDESTYDATLVYKDKIAKLRKVISVLIVAWVILLFVFINKSLKKRGDDEDDPDDIFAKTPTKTGSRIPRSIVFSDSEDEDEDEEDDEDEDEDEDKTPKKKSGVDMMDLNDL